MARPLYLSLLSLGMVLKRANAYPTSVMLTPDIAFADILADIPFFSVSLFALGTYTFFFVMKRMNLLTTYITLSVATAFLGAIFDLSQIYRRGYWNTTNGLDTSSVTIYMDFREVFFALSIVLRYVSFWLFIAEPPRGELPLLPLPDDRRPNFISLESQTELHSSSWRRYSYLGPFIQWKMFVAIVAVLVLQLLWRLISKFHTFGPIYFVEEGLQIALSTVFILKLFANAIMSPLTPRWKTLRDYSPMVLAILLGLGVAIGNIACFAFSESTVGRLIQAAELYVLLIFVLISAFYKMPVRSSVVAELVRRRIVASGYRDVEPNANGTDAEFTIVQGTDPIISDDFLRPGAETTQDNEGSRTNFMQRISSSSLFGQRFLNLRTSFQTRQNSPNDGDQTRLWNQNELNAEPSPAGQASFRLSMEQTPYQTPLTETKEAPGWREPIFTSVIRMDQGQSAGTSPAQQLASDSEKRQEAITEEVPDDDDASVYTTDVATIRVERDTMELPMEPPLPRNETDSPIYGLNGIIRNLQLDSFKKTPEADITSARSSMDDLARQQMELDQSIAGLRAFSMVSANDVSSRVLSESMQSDISLSNFPNPPFADTLGGKDSSFPGATNSMAYSALSDSSLMVDDIQFQLVPPPVLPAAMEETPERGRNASVPSIARESLDSALGSTARTARMDSQGTQYDVTSFIGGLTVPSGSKSPLSDIAERERVTESDAGSVVRATSPDPGREPPPERPAEPSSPENSESQPKRRSFLLTNRPVSQPPSDPLPTPPPTNAATIQQAQQKARSPTGTFLRPLFLPTGMGAGRGRGLPSGPKSRLEISNPMPLRSPDMLKERTAFQRPRPAPLVLQESQDTQSPREDPPKDGWYF